MAMDAPDVFLNILYLMQQKAAQHEPILYFKAAILLIIGKTIIISLHNAVTLAQANGRRGLSIHSMRCKALQKVHRARAIHIQKINEIRVINQNLEKAKRIAPIPRLKELILELTLYHALKFNVMEQLEIRAVASATTIFEQS